MTDNKQTLELAARKLTLQERHKNGELKSEYFEKWLKITGEEIEFFDLETSVALWNRKWRTTQVREYEGRVEDSFSDILTRLKKFPDSKVFCFTYYWMNTGVFITSLSAIINHFNELMYKSEDEIGVFSSDLKRGLQFEGDRTGSWDKLNYLTVSLSGDWGVLWNNYSEYENG